MRAEITARNLHRRSLLIWMSGASITLFGLGLTLNRLEIFMIVLTLLFPCIIFWYEDRLVVYSLGYYIWKRYESEKYAYWEHSPMRRKMKEKYGLIGTEGITYFYVLLGTILSCYTAYSMNFSAIAIIGLIYNFMLAIIILYSSYRTDEKRVMEEVIGK